MSGTMALVTKPRTRSHPDPRRFAPGAFSCLELGNKKPRPVAQHTFCGSLLCEQSALDTDRSHGRIKGTDMPELPVARGAHGYSAELKPLY
jgi:hypothetical protein